MKKAPRGIRLVIAIIGRRNVGKSSLINALTQQRIAIVSDQPGTTTDPVAKHYELLPVGPVTFYDTAGLDDVGALGEQRVSATRKILFRADIAVIVVEPGKLQRHDRDMIQTVQSLKIPFIVAVNKIDTQPLADRTVDYFQKNQIRYLAVSAQTGKGITRFKEALISIVPADFKVDPMLISDLIGEGDTVLLVTPIDLAAPKGRIILPQVQVIRDALDSDAVAVIVKEREIDEALSNMRRKPALVVTDSQVVLKVAGDVDPDIPLTTFSILFARNKGDLQHLAAGASAIDKLQNGDRVLMSEACSHHIQADDIGRVKIPRWVTQYTGKQLVFEMYSGHDFPDDLAEYKLVIHCGGCMLNRMEMIRRINECTRRGVPVTNYGLAISKVQGVFSRVIAPFHLTLPD